MTKVQCNALGKVYVVNGKALLSGGGVTPTGKYQLLERIKDDSNNEIGTVSGFFTDANDVEYAVVCLDAQYRAAYTQWCSEKLPPTNMPMYSNSVSAFWYNDAKETATQNTQLILDYCSAHGYSSTACTHSRSKSFTINGTTYYGQFPNMREVFDMWSHASEIQQMDTSASSNSDRDFSSPRAILSSTQYGSTNCWYLNTSGYVTSVTKTSSYFTCPVLEIPVS